MQATTRRRAIPRPRCSGLTPSMRRCASSGASGSRCSGSTRESSSSVADPAMTPVDERHQHRGVLGPRADVGDPREVRPPSPGARARELAIGARGRLAGCRVLGLAGRDGSRSRRAPRNRTRQPPVAGPAHRRGMDTQTPVAQSSRRRRRWAVSPARAGAARRPSRALRRRAGAFGAARRHRRPATGPSRLAHRAAGRQLSLPLPRERGRRRARMVR